MVYWRIEYCIFLWKVQAARSNYVPEILTHLPESTRGESGSKYSPHFWEMRAVKSHNENCLLISLLLKRLDKVARFGSSCTEQCRKTLATVSAAFAGMTRGMYFPGKQTILIIIQRNGGPTAAAV